MLLSLCMACLSQRSRERSRSNGKRTLKVGRQSECQTTESCIHQMKSQTSHDVLQDALTLKQTVSTRDRAGESVSLQGPLEFWTSGHPPTHSKTPAKLCSHPPLVC